MNSPFVTSVSLDSYPDSLKDGQFVAVCPHLSNSDFGLWGNGGSAVDENGLKAVFHASVWCAACAVSEAPIEFRRSKFYGGRLNFGWWEFSLSRIGRPKKA